MNYRKSKKIKFDGWTEEDGLMYLDTSSPTEYEPESIIAVLGADPNSEEIIKIFEDQAKRHQSKSV